MKRIFIFLLSVFILTSNHSNAASLTSKVAKGAVKTAFRPVIIVGGGSYLLYKYKTNVNNIIKNEFSSKENLSNIQNNLTLKLNKKILKTRPEKLDILIYEIQKSLKLYIVMYDGNKVSSVAQQIAINLGIFDINMQNQIKKEIFYKKEAELLISNIIASTVDNGSKTNCQKGSYNRNFIYNDNKDLYKTNSTVLNEWDVGAYAYQTKITKNYNYYIKINGGNYYKYHKDHIPSKKSILEYLKKRDGGFVKFNSNVIKNIYDNSTTVVLNSDIHRIGRTFGQYIIDDSNNLYLAMIKDFVFYYVYYYSNNLNDHRFKFQWSRAFAATYIRNEQLCLFVNK